jgi:hypothetical protein
MEGSPTGDISEARVVRSAAAASLWQGSVGCMQWFDRYLGDSECLSQRFSQH